MTDAADRRRKLGIDDSLPDVYESPDVPDVLPTSISSELDAAKRALREARPGSSAPIDRAPLEPSSARGIFQAKDAVSRPPQTDFSSAAHVRRREEWRLVGRRERSLESPEERYLRLMAEVSGLESDLAMAEVGSDEGHDVFPSELKNEAKLLHERLEKLDISRGGTARSLRSSNTLNSALDRIKHITHPSAKPSTPLEDPAPTTRRSYTEIERRIARLAEVIGDGDLASLFPNVCTALDAIEGRLALIDPERLEAAGKQIQALEQRTEQVRGGIGGSGEQLAVLQRLEVSIEALPMVLARLRTLKGIHEAAASASEDISSLIGVQAGTEASLKSQGEALAGLRGSLAGNLETMASNLQAVEERIKALEAADGIGGK